MTAMYLALLAILGALLGSYAGAVITRYPRASALDGRSHCPRCLTQLKPEDLVPILSFVFLKGKCRYCKKEIDWSHPLAETIGAAGLPALYLLLPSPVFLPTVIALWMVSVVLAGIDLRAMRLPNMWVLGASGVAVILAVQATLYYIDPDYLIRFGVAAAVTFGMYVLLTFFTRGRGIGMGDVKLAPIIAACVALVGYAEALIAVFLPFLLGTAMVVYRARKGISWRGEIMPFGPFLIMGGWIAVFFGGTITTWYLGFFS